MYLFIRQERQRHKWTQEYVAQNVGLTKTAIHDIETGKQKPSYDVLVKLEDLFHKNHRKLFAVVDDTPISRKEDTTKRKKNQGVKKNE